MPLAVAIQVCSLDWGIRISRKSRICGLTPLSVVCESRGVSLSGVVTHLTGRLDEPGTARSIRPDITHIAVAARTSPFIHRAALARSGRTWMAQIAGAQVVRGLVQA